MTREEFSRLVLAIKEYYVSDKILQTEEAVRLWYEQLKDLDYRIASVALSKHVETNKYPPTIAEIREHCTTTMLGENLPWEAAWQTVLDAIRYYGYVREKEALESLDDNTRIIVSRLGWKELCWSENISIERASFRDAYKAMIERNKKENQIAPAVRKMIQSIQYANTKSLTVEKPKEIPLEEPDEKKLDVDIDAKMKKLKEKLKQ